MNCQRNPFRTLANPLPLLVATGLLLIVCQADLASADTQQSHNAESMQMAMQDTPDEHAKKHRDPAYVCPMHPSVVQDGPGSCPICGMFLVTAKAEDAAGEQNPMDMPIRAKPMESHGHHHPESMLPGIKPAAESMPAAMQDSPEEHAKKHRDPTYICPMHPSVVQDGPGSCPICGMFLVAAKAEDAAGGQKPMDMPTRTKPMEPHDHHHPDSMLPGIKPAAESMPAAMQDSPEEHAKKHRDPTYICPMHPQIVQGHPGSCPICGMHLEIKSSTSRNSEEAFPQVFLSGATIQNMRVRTAQVKRGVLETKTKTQGIVSADDERVIYLHPRAAGWIETLYVRTEGDEVERKDTLADFYSPYITQVQLDFLQALEEQDLAAFGSENKTDINNKVNALRNSLRLLNVMDMEIKRIENSRSTLATIPIMAPHSGDITELGVREGMYVEPFNRMFTIVDLSHVWVMIDLHEHQAAWVKSGMQMEIEAPAIPGRKWTGKIDYIYPVVNPKTRTLRARIEIPNPDEALLLNMFVDVSLLESARKNTLSVPREAVILSGERETVIKVLEKGHFQPVEVTSGIWSNGKAEILSGLEEGDEVVVSGQFLIDSESSLQASFLRMAE